MWVQTNSGSMPRNELMQRERVTCLPWNLKTDMSKPKELRELPQFLKSASCGSDDSF